MNKLEFGYIEGSAKGPEHWGDLKPEWAVCKNGKMQSPVDLSSRMVEVTPNLGQLKTTYKPQTATVLNKGFTIAVSLHALLPTNYSCYALQTTIHNHNFTMQLLYLFLFVSLIIIKLYSLFKIIIQTNRTTFN